MPRLSTPRIVPTPRVDVLARDEGAGRREHALHAGARVRRAAHDLHRLAGAGVDHADAQPVGVRMLLGRDDIRDRVRRKRLGLVLDRLDLEPDARQRLDDLVEGGGGVEVVLQPGEGEFHASCSAGPRKRATRPTEARSRSHTDDRVMAARSTLPHAVAEIDALASQRRQALEQCESCRCAAVVARRTASSTSVEATLGELRRLDDAAWLAARSLEHDSSTARPAARFGSSAVARRGIRPAMIESSSTSAR